MALIRNLIITKLKYIYNKYNSNKTIKITSCCGVCKAIYDNGSYVLLFGKGKWWSF